MSKNFKILKSYFNEYGIRFNLDKERIWKFIEDEFGIDKAVEIDEIFNQRFEKINIDNSDVYKFVKNFNEATTLMLFQSDWFLKNSLIIYEDLIDKKPKNILELGCYTGIFCNFISEMFSSSNITGVDRVKNLIQIGNDKFKKSNLKLESLDYKNLLNLKTKFDFIFTNFGIEDIPKVKLDTYKIRNNNYYFSGLKYFSDFFSYLNNVSSDSTEFLCIARIPTIECLLTLIDGAQSQGWKWLTSDLEYISINSESVPKLRFAKGSVDQLEIDDFIQKTTILKDIDKNEIAIVKSYEDQKSKIKLLNKDSHKYEDTNDELFYEIGLIKNQLVLFIWTTLGWFKFEKFENKEDLLKYFTEETGLMFDPNLINIK